MITPDDRVGTLPQLDAATAYVESLPHSSRLLLQKTQAWIAGFQLTTTSIGTRFGYEVRIPNPIMELATPPNASDIVSIECYFVNLPFTRSQNSIINLTVAGKPIEMTVSMRGRISHKATIPGVPYGEKATVIGEMESLGWLLSLATGRMCHIAKIEARRGKTVVYRELRDLASSVRLDYGTPLVLPDLLPSQDIARFLEHAFLPFQQQNPTYRLNNLIGLGILAKDTNYSENMLLLMANFLEVVRYNYASNNSGTPNSLFKRGTNDNFSWVTSNQPSWANAGDVRNHAASFRDILYHFCLQMGISIWDDDFRDIRNEIIHTGKVLVTPTQRYLKLHHFCDTVLLALLDWDYVQGTYVPIHDPNRRNPTPGNNSLPVFTR